MALPYSNAQVQIRRQSYNAATKQTAAATLPGLVPMYIRDIALDLRAQGMAAGFDYRLGCDGATDLRDGDQIVGYNPAGAAVPPVLTVRHVGYHMPGTPYEYKTALLAALKPAGSST